MARRSFSFTINEFVRLTGLSADIVIRKVSLDLFARVLRHSPVDTGRFRANWRIGVNRVDLSTTKAGNPPTAASGKHQGNPPHGTPATGTEQAKGELETLAAKFGNTVYITNNLPYAKRLEDGWSKQAPGPGGIATKSVREVKTELTKIVAAARREAR